jgi:cytochrome P450
MNEGHLSEESKSPPVADATLGLDILKELIRERSLLVAMEQMHTHVGDIFQITLPGFQPVVVSGPEFNRQVLVTDRGHYRWRGTKDPVIRLLRHGVLVEDGETHDELRACMEPALRRTPSNEHIPTMIAYTDQILEQWPAQGQVDMLVEMRKVALLILMGTLYGTDFTPHLQRLWEPILKAIEYISPGFWILWPTMPRPGYKEPLQELDEYLYKLIRQRRAEGGPEDDLLGRLISAPELDDDLIRDQLLTMLIAGHDTSTAMLSWTLYLLGTHPEALVQAQAEVDDVCGTARPTEEMIAHLPFLDQVLKESLRLYPPIHVGNRFAAQDTQLQDYHIPHDTRVMVSMYLSHRDEEQWPDPAAFCPHRFERTERREQEPLAYIPFGGGPRNCIGATFAQIEGRVIMARILQQFTLELVPGQKIKAHMGATLEPRPGVEMTVRRRS